MARGGKKNRDSDSVSDPSDGEYDSDDSMRASRPKKKVAKKEQPKTRDHQKAKAAPRRASPKKKQHHHLEEEAGGSHQVDEDEDDEQRGLVEDYDEEDLLNIKVPDAPIPCMAADGGDRLIITDIVVENFKSYYGSRRIGPFHHSFTSIIGPNGSGKSNVIDALLFVFGYKASKIRSKKVSVLIHSSAGKDDIPSCTVKISFQKIIDGERGTYEMVPNSSFSVSRTAYKNNNSEYRMDGVRTTFKEVAARLKAVGIDLIHNRFLILQGEVEQIAMMKPKSVNGSEDGMLEYLEDIIGSSRYKMPIEKLTSKLEKLQIERSHQITKVNTAHREKEALDEPVQTQLAYMTMENEVAALQCKQYLHKKYHAEDAAAKLKPDQEKNRNELTQVTKALADLQDKLKEKKEGMEKISKKLVQVEADIHKTTNELECLVQRDKKRINDLNRLQNEMKRLQVEAKKEKDKLDEVMKAPVEAKAKIEQLGTQLAEYRDELATAQELFDDNFPKYNKKTEADRAKKTKLEEEYSGYAARLADAEAKCKLAESSLRSLVEEYEKKKAQLEELQRSLKANQEKLDKDKQTRTEVQAHIAKKQEETKEARGEMEEIAVRKDQIDKRIKELAPLFNEKQEEAETRRRHNKITEAFENAVRNGKMKGYIGRVGDLGSIDAKFDRAVSNNFGGNLDLYLVEDHNTVKEGIQMLKEMKMNTKFVGLDRLQHLWGQIKKLEAERSSPARRIFAEIRCEDRFKPAFFHAVKTAYVVDNMDQARGLHQQLLAENKRESIVTMDGSMISARGTYIGGGQVKEGKMGTAKVVRRESTGKDDEAAAKRLREARKEKIELDQEMQMIMQRNRELDLVIAQSAQPLYSKQHLVKELDRSIKLMEERIRVQEQQRAERAREMEKAKVDEKELDRKEKEIEKLKDERDSVSEDSRSFKSRIKEIDAEMAKVYSKLVKPHETTLVTTREQIDRAEKEMGKQQAVINGAERNIAKQQLRVNDVDKDVDQKRTKSSGLMGDSNMYEEARKDKEQELREHKSRLDRYEERQRVFRENTSDLDREEVALEKQQKLLTEMLRDRDNQMRGLLCAIKEYDKLVSQLTLHNIAELLVDIPEEMRQCTSARRFMDGESESEAEEDGESHHGSPSKRKAAARREKSRDKKKEKKRKSESPRKKKQRRQIDDDDEEEEEEEEEREEDEDMATEREAEEEREEPANAEMEAEDGEREEGMETGAEAAGDGGEEGEGEPMAAEEEEEETDEQREDRRAKKLATKREKKKQREETLMNGKMPDWSRGHIQKSNQDNIAALLERLDRKLASMKKHLQPHVLEDFKKKVDKLRKEGELLTVIKDKYTAHRDKLDGLKKLRLADFMGGFESISTALRELYQMITLGGDASLELKDVIDPFIEGVQFMVRPPKKSWKQIENLSGGEKTLSSLALVFALHKYRPTPLYVMDEIDAALDFRNVSIIGHYIKDRTKNAQFIIISLRNNMFELADRLIGIYKVHDCTRNVVVDPKKVLEETKELRSGLNKVRLLMESNKIQTGVGI